MAGATIDWLSGGRFMFGFGPSGPQVSEGWYGVPYVKPYGRTREYVEVVRKIIAREGPLDHQGEHYQLPLPADRSTGQGKALKLNFHPLRNQIPVFIAAIGEKSVSVAAEIADGWIPIFFSADTVEETFGASIDAGLGKAGKTRDEFEISPSLQVAIDGDLETARNVVKAGLLLYLGGMGSKKENFYVRLASRIGFEEEAHRIQELYLEGKRDEAYKAIPDSLADAVSLVGPEGEVAERLEALRACGVARVICSPAHVDPAQVRHTLARVAAIAG
jgi:F420-dependent oxidoreductase-like protein